MLNSCVYEHVYENVLEYTKTYTVKILHMMKLALLINFLCNESIFHECRLTSSLMLVGSLWSVWYVVCLWEARQRLRTMLWSLDMLTLEKCDHNSYSLSHFILHLLYYNIIVLLYFRAPQARRWLIVYNWWPVSFKKINVSQYLLACAQAYLHRSRVTIQ